MIKTVLLSLTLIGMSSCGSESSSNLQGSAGRTPRSEPQPKQPERDPNICYSDMVALNKVVFAYENTDARAEERAKCLAEAVKGIGRSTAEKLLEQNELSIAPRTYDQFRAHMDNLEKKGFSDIYRNTILEFGDENRNIFGNAGRDSVEFRANEVIYFVGTGSIKKGYIKARFPGGNYTVRSAGGYNYEVSEVNVARTKGCSQGARYCVDNEVYHRDGRRGYIVGILPSNQRSRIIWRSAGGYYYQNSENELSLAY